MLNLRESLLSYQTYLESLNKEKLELCEKVRKGLAVKLMEVGGESSNEGKKAKGELDASLKEIDLKF